ncbi:MAG: tetraacyldisaccharide 4'-kinase [Bacteroides sp.]|nr:tetraacyldisaccharide 4'-kinase [Bacteroides sp.]
MKTTKDKILIYLLTPLSWIYGGVTAVRNWLFDQKILKETEYDIPIVGVGNLTVGGTGKTPHVEYIVSNLANDYNIAVLSRGYKRKTRGFVLANSKSTPDLIGDEPYQINQKFGSMARVAVCENRRKGIEELCRIFPDLDMIVLDDSFQHRWVKPKVSVLLMDYNRPIYEDHLLPLGRLRESKLQINRADMVVVTKCPEDTLPIDFRIKKKDLNLLTFQKLFFSRYEYGALEPVFSDDAPYHANLSQFTSDDAVLLLTGIAHPRYLVRHFKRYPFKVKVDHYPDHHNFTRSDIDEIAKKFKNLTGVRKIIVTTEKDAVRLMHNPYYPKALKPFTFFLPVTVRMVNALDEGEFIPELKSALGLRPSASDEEETTW